jgi:hypothetical protein
MPSARSRSISASSSGAAPCVSGSTRFWNNRGELTIAACAGHGEVVHDLVA